MSLKEYILDIIKSISDPKLFHELDLLIKQAEAESPEEESRFVKSLLKKLGYPVTELSDEDLEDAHLLHLMVSEKKEDYISESDVLDALK